MTQPARVKGLHHLTLVTRDMDEVVRFFIEVLGILLVKIDHNFDRPEQKHYFFGDDKGRPGTLVTFFEIPDLPGNTLGPGGMHHVAFWGSAPVRTRGCISPQHHLGARRGGALAARRSGVRLQGGLHAGK